jgi:hypothetical protein
MRNINLYGWYKVLIEITHQPSLQQVNITHSSDAKKITDGSANREQIVMALQTPVPSRRERSN